MSMPSISDINPNINIVRDDAVNIIMASIAMEELALAHILNAEGEKLQYVLGTLEGRDPGEITICDIMEVNNSIHKTLRDVIKEEMLLQLKLEDAIELAENTGECQLTIRGQKIWGDDNNVAGTRPSTVEISLLRDGEVFRTVTVDSMGDGAYSFACLPVWKNAGEKYVYTVDELVVPGNYRKSIDGYNITNVLIRFIFQKSDAVTLEPLANATFRLSQEGTAFELVTTSTSQGIVDFGVIPEGTYTLEETISPEGYLPNTTVYSAVVASGGLITVDDLPIQEFVVMNTPMEPSAPPMINAVTENDIAINGSGTSGCVVTVIFPSGAEESTTVAVDESWSVPVPETLTAGDVINAYQTCSQRLPSDTVGTTVSI